VNISSLEQSVLDEDEDESEEDEIPGVKPGDIEDNIRTS